MKILIEMMHGLGDCIFILPMLENLKKEYPNSHITIIVSSEMNKLLLNMGNTKIDKFIIYKKSNSVYKKLKAYLEMILPRYDIAILSVIVSNKKGRLFFSLIRSSKYLGEQYQLINRNLLCNRVHFVNRNLNLLKDIIKHVDFMNPHLTVDERLYKKTLDKFGLDIDKKVIGICIGRGLPSFINKKKYYPKRWNDDNIKDLIDMIMNYDVIICLFGGTAEADFISFYNEEVKSKKVKDFVGKTTIVESVAIAKRCDVVVGIDTGMQHIADAVGTPTISIFGPTNPRACGAYSKKAEFIEKDISCRYCYGTAMCFQCTKRICMKNITPIDVFEKMKKYFL